MSINWSYNTAVKGAFIITIEGNETSERLSKRCQKSCKAVDMPYEVWPAIDGTKGTIDIPTSMPYLNWLKIVDKNLSITEYACALSHISLWAHCLDLDQPIVILEHDAIMLKSFMVHSVYNSIMYLGSHEQVKQGWQQLSTPPHATNGVNNHFICRAHAYSIDPAIAKNLMSHVIKYGIHKPLDIMMRADIFPIIQDGIYAYDEHGPETTIGHKRNY